MNQGGASGSTGIQFGGKQMRAAAAEARRVLVEMAAEHLKLPADKLTVTDGVVHVQERHDDREAVTYAELIGGRYFNVQLDWNKQIGNALYAPGKAQPKKPKDYKIVGKPMPREDIAPMRLLPEPTSAPTCERPGMVHARMIRPAVAGATTVKVDESSIKDIPGARVDQREGLPRRRRRQGMGRDQGVPTSSRCEWSDAKPPFIDQATLYDHIRKAAARKNADRRQAGRRRRRGVQESPRA